jgi:hypothetical protein
VVEMPKPPANWRTRSPTVVTSTSIGGVPITIPTAPNSKIALPGVGQLTVNEQIPVNGADAGLTVGHGEYAVVTARRVVETRFRRPG